MSNRAEYPKKFTSSKHHSSNLLTWNLSAVLMLMMILSVALNAQTLRLSGGNSAQYWIYVDDSLQEENYKEHLEDKLKLTLIYGDIGLRGVFFIADPSLSSPYRLTYVDYTAFYNRDPVNIQYGYYYKTFGRGLVLNQFIDEDFKIDNSLFGLQAAIKYFSSQLTLLSGHPRNIFFEENTYRIKNDNDTTAQIRGIDFETSLIPKLKLGGNYVRINRETDLTPKAFTELYGGNILLRYGPFDAYLEYAQRLGTRPGLGGRLKGYGVLFSTGLAIPGLGISFQALDYDTIGVGGADYRYNEPVTPIKTGISVNRGLDEIGFGASIFLSPVDWATLELDNNKISTHDTTLNRLEQIFVTNESMDAVIEQAVKLQTYPSFDLEITGGVEKLRKQGIEDTLNKTETKPYLDVTYDFGSFFIETSYEHNFISVDSNGSSSDYYEHVFAFSIGKPEAFVLTLRYERRNRVPAWLAYKISEETSWPLVELSLDLTTRHNLRIRAGGEKGGLVCSGGVCRFEEPFKGVKLSVTSIF